MRKFFDKYNLGKPYIYIHSHKQEHAKHIVDNKPDWVTHIIIFGSAVHSWHYYEKDLDICIIGENTHKLNDDFSYRSKLKMKGCSYDFVEYSSVDELLTYKESINSIGYNILNEGVFIYGES